MGHRLIELENKIEPAFCQNSSKLGQYYLLKVFFSLSIHELYKELPYMYVTVFVFFFQIFSCCLYK